MLSVLLIPVILRGFIMLLAGGFIFPAVGVYIVHLRMLPVRFFMMHAVILGGIIALAFKLPLLPVILVLNVMLVFSLVFLFRQNDADLGPGSMFLMVLSMGIAGIIAYKSGLPAMDTGALLWGSPFSAETWQLPLLLVLGALFFFYHFFARRKIMAILFNRDIAVTSGINVQLHFLIIIFFVAAIISVAIKMLGAFLVDSMCLLPAIAAAAATDSFGKSIRLSSVVGVLLAAGGFVISVLLDLPVSGCIAVLAAFLFILQLTLRKVLRK